VKRMSIEKLIDKRALEQNKLDAKREQNQLDEMARFKPRL
jgi:flagellar biosynthesis chaperone FliJ